MATPSLIIDLHDGIWAALEASAAWAALVEPNNRIRWDKGVTPRKLGGGQSPADFNQAEMLPNVDWDSAGFTDGQTFKSESGAGFDPGADCWQSSETLTLRMELTTRRLKVGDVDDLLMETRSALLEAGPWLGLTGKSFVRWTASARSRLTDETKTGQGVTRRIVTELSIRVQVNADGASTL